MKIIADDFGLHPAINQAILQLAESNKLHGISIMINRSLDPEEIERLLQLRSEKKIQIGLHLELLNFKSLGLFPYTAKIQKSILDQLNSFERIFRQFPDFVDGHQHIHIYPIFKNPLMAALIQLQIKPWIRSVRIPEKLYPLAWGPKRLYYFVLNFFGSKLYHELTRLDWPTNEFLYGSFANSGLPNEIFKKFKLGSPKTVYFCHPSLNSLYLSKNDPIYHQRQQDYELLKNENLSF